MTQMRSHARIKIFTLIVSLMKIQTSTSPTLTISVHFLKLILTWLLDLLSIACTHCMVLSLDGYKASLQSSTKEESKVNCWLPLTLACFYSRSANHSSLTASFVSSVKVSRTTRTYNSSIIFSTRFSTKY